MPSLFFGHIAMSYFLCHDILMEEVIGFNPQSVIHDFHEALTPGERPPTFDMTQQLQQEGHEVYQEIEGMTPEEINNLSPDKKQRLAGEVGDVIIAGLGVLDSIGMDFENVFWSKISVMIEKYPPSLIQRIMSEQNLCRAEAMAQAKTIYESRAS